MNNETKHTPTPCRSDFQSWVAHTMLPDSILNSPKPVAYITVGGRDEPGNRIVAAIFDVDGLRGSHIAQEIVTACNSHDALVEAVKLAQFTLSNLNGEVSFEVWKSFYDVKKQFSAALKAAGVEL